VASSVEEDVEYEREDKHDEENSDVEGE